MAAAAWLPGLPDCSEPDHGTIPKLLVLAGEKCEPIMAEKIRTVQVRDVEAGEV